MIIEVNRNKFQIIEADTVEKLREVIHRVDEELNSNGIGLNEITKKPQEFWKIAEEILLPDELNLLEEALNLKALEE